METGFSRNLIIALLQLKPIDTHLFPTALMPLLAIQYFKKAAQSVGQSAISGLLRLRLAMTERKKSCQSF
jgi:hypothetical protein